MKKIILFVFIFLGTNGIFAQKNPKSEIRSKESFAALDFSCPIHSVGFSINAGCSFTRTHNYIGNPIIPTNKPQIIPEFVVQYNCIVRNHFGVSLEIPFGLFLHQFDLPFEQYGIRNQHIEIGSPYIGFIPKLAYYRDLGDKAGMMIEVGLKFMPFSFDSEHWEPDPTEIGNVDIINGQVVDNSPFDADVPQKNYFIPDATASFLFNFHGKNPRNNFVVGIVGNLSFVNRMKISYEFLAESLFPQEAWTAGDVAWSSSSIGLTFGFRFMGLRP